MPECLTGTCAFITGSSSGYVAWLPIAAIAVFITLIAVATLYMFGRALGRRDWEALARTELYQVGVAAIWVFIIIVPLTLFMCNLSCQISGDDPFTTAVGYIHSVQSRTEDFSVSLLNIAKKIRIGSAQADYIWPTGVIVKRFEGCAMIANNYETIVTILAPFIGSLIFQQIMLLMINNFAFQILLPIGVIMRVIPPLRSAGATVMAIAIALYIVLPLTYVFADKATQVPISKYHILPADPPNYDLNCMDAATMKTNLESLGYLLPQAAFFPALSMIITLGAARVLSKVLMYDFMELF